MLNFAVMSLFIGMASYVGTFVAQYFGSGRLERVGPALWQGLYVALAGGILVMGIIPLARPLFDFIGHDAAVRKNEVVYFQYLCTGAVWVIASASLSGFFSGIGRTKIVMWVNIEMTAINILLDYLLIFGRWGLPEMGIRGAAIATVIAGFYNFIAYFAIIVRPFYNRRFHTLRGWRFERALFARLVRFGLPSGVQFFLDMVGFTAFISISGINRRLDVLVSAGP